jgi:hypothetical protein
MGQELGNTRVRGHFVLGFCPPHATSEICRTPDSDFRLKFRYLKGEISSSVVSFLSTLWCLRLAGSFDSSAIGLGSWTLNGMIVRLLLIPSLGAG